ncbi:hypothetical protein BASA81_003907 [Batrachochytrium salamandrivorans]|nr:hypothetical protein BASA81_003907 [Batrachochytrium salamandrivorans]
MKSLAAAVLVGAGVYWMFNKRLDSLAKLGNELRSKRTRKLESQLGVVILGWEDSYSSAEELGQLLLTLSTKLGFRFEFYLPSTGKEKHQSPNLFPISPPITLHVALFGEENLARSEAMWMEIGQDVKMALQHQGSSKLALYVVNRSVYTEYGEYDGLARLGWDYTRIRDWIQPTASPYVIAHTAFPKPTRFAHKTTWQWAQEDWFSKQSAMSEMIQPRARYVRNVVLCAENDTLPQFAALVIEAWPSPAHVSNPFIFFHASNPLQLVLHILVMTGNVIRFTDLWKMQGTMLREYIYY